MFAHVYLPDGAARTQGIWIITIANSIWQPRLLHDLCQLGFRKASVKGGLCAGKRWQESAQLAVWDVGEGYGGCVLGNMNPGHCSFSQSTFITSYHSHAPSKSWLPWQLLINIKKAINFMLEYFYTVWGICVYPWFVLPLPPNMTCLECGLL